MIAPFFASSLTVADAYSGFVFYSSLFYLPQFFQVALSYSAVRSGVFLLPVLVSQTLASFVSVSLVITTAERPADFKPYRVN